MDKISHTMLLCHVSTLNSNFESKQQVKPYKNVYKKECNKFTVCVCDFCFSSTPAIFVKKIRKIKTPEQRDKKKSLTSSLFFPRKYSYPLRPPTLFRLYILNVKIS